MDFISDDDDGDADIADLETASITHAEMKIQL
jgi:hypothetical protein